jgi:C_GCAxxG_C_C family probable redox protein
MLKETAATYSLEKGCNCAESTLLAVNDEYGLGLGDEEIKLVSGFGGGLASGLACGALCGSLAALGRMLLNGRAHTDPDFRPLCAEYVAAFREAMGGTDCREIRDRWFVPGRGCVAAVEKNAELFASFVESHGLNQKESGK